MPELTLFVQNDGIEALGEAGHAWNGDNNSRLS